MSEYLDCGGMTADELRSLLGKLESTKLAVERAPLHYRALQAQHPRRKRGSKWRGRSFIALSNSSELDLAWWRDEMGLHAEAPLSRGPPPPSS